MTRNETRIERQKAAKRKRDLKWYHKNKKEVNKRRALRGDSARWYKENTDIAKLSFADWRKEHPEKCKEYNRKHQKKYQKSLAYRVLLQNRKDKRAKLKKQQELQAYLSKPKWYPGSSGEEKKAEGPG